MTVLMGALVTHQAGAARCREFDCDRQVGLCNDGFEMGGKYSDERALVARSSSFSARLWVSEALQVHVGNTHFRQRVRQSVFRKAFPARDWEFPDVDELRDLGELERSYEIDKCSVLVPDRRQFPLHIHPRDVPAVRVRAS